MAADGGTLVLDEIGELPPAMQVKLLRVLEDGKITRVGDATPSSQVGDRRMQLPDTRELIQQIIQRGIGYRELQAIVDKEFLLHLHAVHGPVLTRIAEALGKGRDKTRDMLAEIGLYPWR